jgi:hypothetical protein
MGTSHLDTLRAAGYDVGRLRLDALRQDKADPTLWHLSLTYLPDGAAQYERTAGGGRQVVYVVPGNEALAFRRQLVGGQLSEGGVHLRCVEARLGRRVGANRYEVVAVYEEQKHGA